MAGKKAKTDQEEITATFEALPLMPPEGAEEFAKLSRGALVYMSAYVEDPLTGEKIKMAKCKCSLCNDVYYLEQVSFRGEGGCGCAHMTLYGDPVGFIDPDTGETRKSYETCICQNCGGAVEAIHIGKLRADKCVESKSIISLHNIRGHLVMLKWIVERYIRKDATSYTVIRRWEGGIYSDRSPVRVTGHRKNMGGSEIFYDKWMMMAKYEEKIGETETSEIMPFTRDLIYSTDCDKSGIYEYIYNSYDTDIYPGAYMQLQHRYPNVENLVKSGYAPYLNKLISECMSSDDYYSYERFHINVMKEYINFRENKPAKMTGIDKTERFIANGYKPAVTRLYKELRERGIRLDKPLLDFLDKSGVYELREHFIKPRYGYTIPVVRLINYVIKQRARYGDINDTRLNDFGYIRDYYDAIVKVYGNIQPSLLFPKDIIRAHDNMIAKVKEKEDEKLNLLMQTLSAERDKYRYTDDELGLLIRPCETHGELITEGKLLEHCVARYASDHANGKTTIYFIRRTDEPDRPFFTLEFRNGKVNQNRGYKNRGTTPEVDMFVERWLKYIKNIKEKENDKNRRNNRSVPAASCA